MIRPEVQTTLWRWREVIAGIAMFGLGLWWAMTSFGALFLIGCGFALAGAALSFAGIQRGRFRSGGGGAGVVDIDERRISYFGPFGGGVIAVDDMREVAIDGAGNWLLSDLGGQSLLIPMTAEGADALFDAFSALPGLGGSDLVSAARSAGKEYTVIWAKPHNQLH